MSFLTPIVIGDIIIATGSILWVAYYLRVTRKEMAFKGDLNVLMLLPPLVTVGYGVWYLATTRTPEAIGVLLIALVFFIFFAIGGGGLTEKGIVGGGGFTTEWERIKDIWFQSTRDNSLALMYRINGMPGVRHFRMVGNDRKNVSKFVKRYYGKAPADRKPE